MTTQAPLELKKTVNLPKTGFAQKANLPQNEPARLKRWAETGLYELIRRSRAAPRTWRTALRNEAPSSTKETARMM